MLHESKPPPKFFPDDFKDTATTILQSGLGLTVDGITHESCRTIYLKLVELIDGLLSRGVPICSGLSFMTSNSDSSSDDDN